MAFSFDQPYLVVTAVVERNGKFLLIQESHLPDKGKWNLPAGRLDLGEDLVAAVIREVLEETGLVFEPKSVIGIRSVVRSNIPGRDGTFQSVRVVFGGTVTGEVALGAGDGTEDVPEIANFQWLAQDEIEAFPLADLRYHDIKDLIRDAAAGVNYPLTLLAHYVQD